MSAGTLFLDLNGYKFNAAESEAVASGETSEHKLAQWFSDNSKQLV